MSTGNPCVSVIIPTYKRAHMIGPAIHSVFGQTYQDFEIIVVDDASPDSTEEVVKSFGDPRISYIRHEHNKGGSAARNTGILPARGEFIAFLDSDDEWLPEKLAKQVQILSEDPSCAAVYTDIVYTPDVGRIVYTAGLPGPEGMIYNQLLESNCVGSTSVVVARRECFDKAGLFDPDLPSGQDWDMWIRIGKHYRFRRVPEPLVKYRVHQASITASGDAAYRGQKAILDKHHAEIRAAGRRIEALHYFRLGNILCHQGQMQMGRRHLLHALSTYPWSMRRNLYALASLFGARMYKRLAKLKKCLPPDNTLCG